jgi:hypothetical protein
MNRKWRLRLLASLVLALCLVLMPVFGAFATNPTVVMTVTAGIVSINNTQASWALGYATVNETIYFSANNSQDDNYSMITNTGSLACDIEIQGTDFDGGSYPWTLGAASGNQTYSLYANSSNGTSTYDIEIQSSGYTDPLVENLTAGATYVWSMKFTAPNEFNASDDKAQKSATVTLVASEH